jgi:vacuolar protein sorting-associated protein 54
MMNEEFIKYLTAEWNRPFDSSEENHFIDEDRLLSIIYGMLRLQRFNFIDAFRDEANTAIKTVVKQTVIETLSSEDNIEDEQRFDGSLFDQLRFIEFSKWITLIECVFNNLLKLLKRINSVYKVMSNGFAAIAERNYNDNKNLEFESTIGDGNVDAIKMLLESDCIELSANLKESLCTICDFAHSRCANIVESRAKEGAFDKLTANDFLQLNKCIEDFTDKCQEICGRRSPNLKLVLQTQANKFATRFHEERKKKLNSLLDIEQWKSVDSVSHEFQDLVIQLVEKKTKFNDIKKFKMNGNSEQKLKSFVLVKGEKFVVVNSVITLINMIIEYCECAHEIRTLSPDLLTRLLDLLKLFNSRTAQLVLGAGALQVAGLKTITARKLIISSRCLQFVIVFIPIAKSHFENLLNPKQQSMCKHFDDIIRSYREHISKIPEKVIAVVREIADSELSKWVAKPPVPSPQFQEISKHLKRLHDNIQDSLPIHDLAELFKQIHNTFKDVLKVHLERLQIKNDGGPQQGLVSFLIHFLIEFKF